MVPAILPEHLVHPLPPHLRHLPAPDGAALSHMKQLQTLIMDEISASGFMPFQRFMELALYAPGLGYYSSGTVKFGNAGDFVTAPEVSRLFGATLARQVAQLIDLGCEHILELGAGTGRMAADILIELARLDRPPQSYEILEVSGDLRSRQRHTLREAAPGLCDCVRWRDSLPERFEGVILANEVLDALPVALVRVQDGDTLELGVTAAADHEGFAWITRPADGELLRAAASLALPDEYTTEIHLAARGMVRSLGAILERGAAFLIDYGFPRAEYYHSQRASGTLMCHYRHHSHADPLALPGLQDITSHIDFTAIAEAAEESGLDLLGYIPQARFLMNTGLLEQLGRIDPQDVRRYAPACAGVQKLLSPAEMGELFKVIAFGRSIDEPLIGFQAGDRSGRL